MRLCVTLNGRTVMVDPRKRRIVLIEKECRLRLPDLTRLSRTGAVAPSFIVHPTDNYRRRRT